MVLPEIPGQELRSAGGREQSAPGLSHDAAPPLIGIRRTLSSGLSERGTVTVRTPFLNVALALSCSTPFGRLIRRSKRPRSEEHTSELQSLMRISYAVYCLKKKKKHSTDRNKTY